MRILDYPSILCGSFVERFKHSLKGQAFSDAVVVQSRQKLELWAMAKVFPGHMSPEKPLKAMRTSSSRCQLYTRQILIKNIIESCLLHLPQHVAEGDIHAHNAARCA